MAAGIQAMIGREAMNRRITLVSAAALAAGALLLSGCQAADSGRETITVWLPPFASDAAATGDLELWNDIVAPFEQEHDVDVDITIIPWESFEERFLTGFSSGDGPDLGYMYAEMIGDYIVRGQLASFEPYLTAEDRAPYYFLEQGLFNGEQYGFPIVVGGARVVYYNKAVLAAAGVTEPPATWDEFIAAGTAVKQSGATPVLMAWGGPGVGVLAQNYIAPLWQAGGEIINDAGTAAAFNTPAGVRAAQFIYDLRFTYDLISETTTAMNNEDLRVAFEAGDVGFVFGDDSDAPRYEDAGIDLGMIVLEDQERATFVAADVLVLAKESAHQELATQLAVFMTSGPSMDRFNTIASYPPISSDQTTGVNPLFADLYSVDADVLRTYPAVPNSASLYTGLYENLQQMLLGSKTPEQALQDAETIANESLSRNAG